MEPWIGWQCHHGDHVFQSVYLDYMFSSFYFPVSSVRLDWYQRFIIKPPPICLSVPLLVSRPLLTCSASSLCSNLILCSNTIT